MSNISLYSYSEPPKLVVNEKRYGRRSRPDISASEDLYSADEESLVESHPNSQLSDVNLSPSPEPRQSPIRGLPEREVSHWCSS